jgi:hypothetical protein
MLEEGAKYQFALVGIDDIQPIDDEICKRFYNDLEDYNSDLKAVMYIYKAYNGLTMYMQLNKKGECTLLVEKKIFELYTNLLILRNDLFKGKHFDFEKLKNEDYSNFSEPLFVDFEIFQIIKSITGFEYEEKETKECELENIEYTLYLLLKFIVETIKNSSVSNAAL